VRPETEAPLAHWVARKCRIFGLLTKLLCAKPRSSGAFLPETGDCRITPTAWLGREDSNLRMAESKSAALPLGDAPVRATGISGPTARRTIVAARLRRNPADQSLRSATSSMRCVMPFVRMRLARGRVGRMFSCRFLRFVRVQMPSAVSSASLSDKSAYLRK
jgi:hypothetical protein